MHGEWREAWGLWKIDDLAYSPACPGYGRLEDVQLAFSDPHNGWMSASAPLGMRAEALYLHRTRDGGQSWTGLVKSWTGDAGGPGWTPAPIVHQLTFIDASTEWAVGGWRWDSGTLLATRNGASSWQPLSLNAPEPNADVRRDYYRPVFLSRDSGVLLVRFYVGGGVDQVLGFFTTGDAGETWSLTGKLENLDMETFDVATGLPWSAIDDTTWFVAVSQSRQSLTRDRGQTWEGFAAEGLGAFELIDVQFATLSDGRGIAWMLRGGFHPPRRRRPACLQLMMLSIPIRPIPVKPWMGLACLCSIRSSTASRRIPASCRAGQRHILLASQLMIHPCPTPDLRQMPIGRL